MIMTEVVMSFVRLTKNCFNSGLRVLTNHTLSLERRQQTPVLQVWSDTVTFTALRVVTIRADFVARSVSRWPAENIGFVGILCGGGVSQAGLKAFVNWRRFEQRGDTIAPSAAASGPGWAPEPDLHSHEMAVSGARTLAENSATIPTTANEKALCLVYRPPHFECRCRLRRAQSAPRDVEPGRLPRQQ